MPVDLFGGPTTVFYVQACGGPGILKKPVSLGQLLQQIFPVASIYAEMTDGNNDRTAIRPLDQRAKELGLTVGSDGEKGKALGGGARVSSCLHVLKKVAVLKIVVYMPVSAKAVREKGGVKNVHTLYQGPNGVPEKLRGGVTGVVEKKADGIIVKLVDQVLSLFAGASQKKFIHKDLPNSMKSIMSRPIIVKRLQKCNRNWGYKTNTRKMLKR